MEPRDVHKLEQETGPMHELAYKLAAYRRSLESQGFSRAEAMRLVEAYQSQIVNSVLGGPK